MSDQSTMSVNGGEPIPVSDVQFVLVPPEPPRPGAINPGPLSLDLVFPMTREAEEWFARCFYALSRPVPKPLNWPGSDPIARQIAKMFGIPLRQLLPKQRSAFDGRYRIRQRNRRRRRR